MDELIPTLDRRASLAMTEGSQCDEPAFGRDDLATWRASFPSLRGTCDVAIQLLRLFTY